MGCNFKKTISKAIFFSDIIELTCSFSRVINDVCEVLDEILCCDNKKCCKEKRSRY